MSNYYYTATYSPDDNKLRLYSVSRLPKDVYDRVKAAGFKWAPKQELFVAPMWTPDREDLLLELAGEIDDEDTSLVQRAEERAERFEEYSSNRSRDADRAHAAVDAIAQNIPLGQPILVGHHSERHARKDAERIQNGMQKAIKMWNQSKYWQDRASGAISNAKYKERPDVRARRIKGLEADIRRCKAHYTPADDPPHILNQKEYDYTTSKYLHDGAEVPHVWCAPKGGRGGSWVPVSRLEGIKAYYARWIEHYENRLVYERAMLADQGGLASEEHDIKPGGQVLVGSDWLTVIRVNKSEGQIVSVTTNSRYVRVKGIEEVKDYKPPTEELAAKVKAATKLPPLCNYPGEAYVHITQEQWDKAHSDYKGTRIVDGNEERGRHRVRCGSFKAGGGYGYSGSVLVFITNAKRKDPPKPDGAMKVTTADLPKTKDTATLLSRPAPAPAPEPNKFDVLEERLKAGVQVVNAPTLFPTPPEIAKQVADLAEIRSGMKTLEPSAGTGNLIAEVLRKDNCATIEAIEVSPGIAEMLRSRFGRGNYNCTVKCADFLSLNGELSGFDRVVMNPPFDHGSDIKHVKHALTKLKEGGRLVAIVANGPRQKEAFEPIATAWIDLPPGSFKETGTNVNTAIVVIDV